MSVTGAFGDTDELADLATIELTDAFFEGNLDRPFDADFARGTLNRTSEQFVKVFLVQQGEHVTQLHNCLKDCATVLGDMEEVLQQFISQLGSIQQDIGHVRETLAITAVQLANAKSAEKVLWAALSSMVVPPEVVQVVTQSNEEQLGTQFMLSVKELLKYLNYRKTAYTRTVSVSATNRSNATSKGENDGRGVAAQEVRFSLAECSVYYDLMNVLDGLTLYACVKIKSFLSRTLGVLTAKNTNISIQQDHVLRPHSFYVHFLRSAVPLLRHVYSAAPQSQDGEDASQHPSLLLPTAAAAAAGGNNASNNSLIPYRIVRALYEEFKREYCVVVSSIYLTKMQEYAFFCNTTEFSTEGSSTTADSAGSGLVSGFFGLGAAASPSPSPAASTAPQGSDGLGSASADCPNYAYTVPLITDTKGGGSYLSMRLGERTAILQSIFAPPLIPTIERATRRKHTYEETLRSMLNLLCDIVSHEYLFTFDFFSGDMTVYVDVFRPTVQFIIDYLSEVVLTNASGVTRRMLNERPRTRVNANARRDTYGLLILIRVCQEYRSMMKSTRKLSCLDSFFDALLVQLWPAFNTCYERQLNALMAAKGGDAMFACMTHLRRVEDRLSFLHPVVKSFAEFSCALMSLAHGAIAAEGRRAAVALLDVQRHAQRRRRANRFSGDVAIPAQVGNDSGDGNSAADASVSAILGSPSSMEGGGDAAPGSEAWDVALRRRALEKIAEEQESDAADSKSHFLTLMGDIGFMRIELVHLLVQVGESIVEDELNPQQRDFLRPLSKAFALNNLFYLLQFSSQYPVLVTRVGPEGGDDGDAGGDSSYRSSHHHNNSSLDGVTASTAVETIPLDQVDEFNGLTDLYSKYRSEFVEQLIRSVLGGFRHVIQDDNVTAGEVLQAADDFVLNWKSALDRLRLTVSQLISDPVNAQEITAQACMDILLYNTRFHTVVASFMEKGSSGGSAVEGGNPFQGRSFRSLIVTNQILLQHLRTFSIPLTGDH